MNLRYDWPPVERYECKADMNTRLRVELDNMFSYARNQAVGLLTPPPPPAGEIPYTLSLYFFHALTNYKPTSYMNSGALLEFLY